MFHEDRFIRIKDLSKSTNGVYEFDLKNLSDLNNI